MTKDEIEKEIKALQGKLGPLQAELLRINHKEQTEVASKVERAQHMQDSFTPAELRYAAYQKCLCGAGMAYPKGTPINGSWVCGAILTGRAEKGSTHSSNMPFAFYEVKSEDQPSANGATTRPQDDGKKL